MARDGDRPAELAQLRREVAGMRRANDRPGGPGRPGRPGRQGRPGGPRAGDHARSVTRRRRLGLLAAVVVVAVLALALAGSGHRSFALPSGASLAGLSTGGRIVAIADSQVGYRTDPRDSYCNKFSADWQAGQSSGCPAGEAAEEWCADFAAWAWRHAGVAFGYGFAPGEINAGAASFYVWGLDTGHWHPAGTGFRASPGDVAIYGLTSFNGTPSAAHVAIVSADPPGQRGPDVINGDGDRTGFSVVETGTDQFRSDTGRTGGAALAGYVSPG